MTKLTASSGCVMDAALKGYIAYTNCTSALAEVEAPMKGKSTRVKR